MVKKGASHVDWAISLGIFLVYILTVIIFIKPGLAPSYKADELLDYVENSLIDEVRLDIEKTPLYIEYSDFEDPGDSYHFAINENPFDVYNNLIMYDENLDTKKGVDFSSNKIKFNHNGDPTGKYWFVYNPEGTPKSFSQGIYELDIVNPSVYEFGIAQNVTGVSESKVLNFVDCSQEGVYDSLKEKWNFPSDKEFEISYYFNDESPVILCSNNIEILQQTNVYVRVLKMPVLGENGEKTKEVTFNVKVW